MVKAAGEAWQSFGASRVHARRLRACAARGTRIEMILNTNRTQTFEPNIFSNLGRRHVKKDILLIKSTNHFYAGFAPIAAEVSLHRRRRALSLSSRETRYRKLSREDVSKGRRSVRALASHLGYVGLPHFPWVWLKLCDRLRRGLGDLRIVADDAVISDENKHRMGACPRRQDIAYRSDGRRLGRVGNPQGWRALSSMRHQVEPTPRLVCPPSAGFAGSRSSGEAST